MKISGWIFDVYAVDGGMRVWMIDQEGVKHRLIDPYAPFFYIGGPLSRVRSLASILSGLNLPLEIIPSEGIEFYSGKPIPVTRVRVANPVHFMKTVRWCTANALKPEAHGISLYHSDLPLSQRYFYERGTFPLAFCEVDVDPGGKIRATTLRDSIWKTDYALPPLSTMTLRMEGVTTRPGHTGPRRLEVVVEGRATSLEAEDEAALIDRFDRLLLRHDPDLILSEWGDSYILPQMVGMAKRKRFPLLLNREPGAGGITRRERSFFTDGQRVRQARSHLLLGRWHVDLHNTFLMGHTRLEGLFEFSRLAKIPVQQMARTTPGAGITSMQADLAFQDGILIPRRKWEGETFKTADPVLRSDRGGLTTPKPGFHEEVAELDFASIYPALMARYNISPETVNCDCCPENIVPEVGHHLCAKRRGLVPRFLEPFLAKRAEYKKLKKAAADPEIKQNYNDRESALKWGLVTLFGGQGYRNGRFGKIEPHEAIASYSREKLLQAKALVEAEGFEITDAIVDSLWLKKPKTSEAEYEALADRISKVCEIPIAFEGIYRWVLFPPSKTDPQIAVPNRCLGVFRSGEVKMRGIEARRGDTPPFIREAQIRMIEILSQAKNKKEYLFLLGQVQEILDLCRQRLKAGHVSFWELAISKTVSHLPREYKREPLTGIVAKELAGRGVRLSPGERISYIITDTKAPVKSERARALGFIDGSWGYDVTKYESLLTEAAEFLFQVDSGLF